MEMAVGRGTAVAVLVSGQQQNVTPLRKAPATSNGRSSDCRGTKQSNHSPVPASVGGKNLVFNCWITKKLEMENLKMGNVILC